LVPGSVAPDFALAGSRWKRDQLSCLSGFPALQVGAFLVGRLWALQRLIEHALSMVQKTGAANARCHCLEHGSIGNGNKELETSQRGSRGGCTFGRRVASTAVKQKIILFYPHRLWCW
jgi:hypothetical protein